MESMNANSTARIGAYTAFGGALCAAIGSGFWMASGADLDAALANNDIANYLTAAADSTQLLVANLTIWIVMALLLGVAATAMTSLCTQRSVVARVARFSYGTGVPLVIVAYVVWLAIVVQIAPDTSPAAILLAETLGWFASRADWIATILIIGIGPTLIALAGRDEWVPNWLFYWSILTALTALLNIVAMFTGGSGLSTYGFLIIPVGIGWMVAAGIVLLRRIGMEGK